MHYAFKTDNYKTFKTFKDNILPPRSYFIPYSSVGELKDTDIRTERYSSSRVTLLNGEWRFAYFSKVSQMPDDIDTESYDFDTVNVPSMWQFTGYEKPYYINTRYPFKAQPPYFPEDCPVSVYVRDIEFEDSDKKRILTFLGVAGSLDVFVNGKYVGYSEGSHNTAEFDLSDFIKQGKNEIAAVVHKWCNGTYLECQDMFRNNGIFRDVYITEYGKDHIYDIGIKTPYTTDGKYDLDISVDVCTENKCTVSAVLEYEGRMITAGKIRADRNVTIAFKELYVNEWSAEAPSLYDLFITLENQNGVVEAVRKRIGFKHIEIKGNVYYFNGRKIKILGVNHHDTNPETGYYMTVADMEKDISVFKQYNINAVRTSHYPPDPTFLDLCDEYGVYVIDEADIECHGVANLAFHRGDCSNNPEWRDHYYDRVYRMYQRDRNHASIAMWSLGNESHGISNHDYCYDLLKKITDIPIHYEGACRTKRWAFDVISNMYFPQSIVSKIADGKGLPKRFYIKPYFLCEYAHAMGVGAGDTEEYVRNFLRADNILGGCVWEFVDHAVYHEKGDYRYTYGGDHNEEFHDDCFCVDGLFFPDRTPHSGALQIKNCYRPIRAKLLSDSKLEFKNINYFVERTVTVKWNALSVSDSESGEFEITVGPQQTVTEEVKIKKSYDAIVLKYYENGREIAGEQISKTITLKKPDKCKTKPVMSKSENKLVFTTLTGEVIFDKESGQIISIKTGEKELLNRGPLSDLGFNISLFRAPFDNDRNYRVWKKYRLNTEHMKLLSIKSVDETDNAYIIKGIYTLSTDSIKNMIKAAITYTVYGDGSILVSAECIKSRKIKHCPRFGITVELKRRYDNVKYFGLGDRESLIDFREHALLGEYEMKVEDMCEKYIKPQESSMRFETRCASLTDDEGVGAEFIAVGKPFIFSADHFNSYQCAKARHREDIFDNNTTFIHLDSYMLGAGSNSCGPRPARKYVKNDLTGEKLEFVFKPIG